MLEVSRSLTAAGGPIGVPLMSTDGLGFSAGGRCLIENVDLNIGAGRFTVVLGANGAGKSLLLRLLHGLITPDAGTVHWQARPLDAAARRLQAMVFQRPVMLRRSVLANLTFALKAHGVPRTLRRERAWSALETARLSDLAQRPARVLSGGEQQRLAIVRALACDPKVLFLDEPTASLDPASTHAIEDLLKQAHRAGVTIVMVTHDAGQARRLAEDVVFMAHGRVTETGPADCILNAPRSDAARAWLDGRLFLDPKH